MSAEQIARVTQPLAELCSRAALARSGAGTGLGVALVRALAEAHGSNVQIDSAPDTGTTVSIRLPAEAPAACAAA
jgi:signal transduction histidine kinase